MESKKVVQKYPSHEVGELKKVLINWLLRETTLDMETKLALEVLVRLMVQIYVKHC